MKNYKSPFTEHLKIDWVNAIFLVSSPIAAVLSCIWLFSTREVPFTTYLLAYFMLMATGMSITMGYHRLFSHKAYEAAWPIRLFTLLFGAASFQNSARRWCSDHRYHHQYVDTNRDPYNIKQGFWHAHMGWIFFKPDPPPTYENVPDLMEDPLVTFQENHYLWLAIVMGLVFPMAVGSLWGDAMGGLILGGIVRLVVNHHFTFSINSFCHYLGTQPYSDQNTSRDSWILPFVTYGEGYHNFHHAFQSDYRNGVRAYHVDPGKWLIFLFSKLGLAKNLRITPDSRVLQARLRMDEKRLVHKGFAADFIIHTRVRIEEAHARFLELKKETYRLKQEKMIAMNETMVRANQRLAELKSELNQAKLGFEELLTSWSQMCAGVGV